MREVLASDLVEPAPEADVAVATLMGYEAASILDSGVIPTVEVSVEKVFTSELRLRIAAQHDRKFRRQRLLLHEALFGDTPAAEATSVLSIASAATPLACAIWKA